MILTIIAMAAMGATGVPPHRHVASCEPTAATSRVLDAAAMEAEEAQTDEESALAELRVLGRALANSPSDLFLNIKAIELRLAIRSHGAQGVDVAEPFAQLAADHPGQPEYPFLRSFVLWRQGETASIRSDLEAQVTQYAFPWSHLLLSHVLDDHSIHEHELARAHAQSFSTRCAGSRSAIESELRFATGDQRTKLLRAYRAQVERSSLANLRSYEYLWTKELDGVLAAKKPGVLRVIKGDIQRLRSLRQNPSRSVLSLIRLGSALAGDSDGVRWADAEFERRFPRSREVEGRTIQNWRYAHREPLASDVQAWRARNQSLLTASADWTEAWPEFPEPWRLRLEALADMPDAASQDVERAAGRLLEICRQTVCEAPVFAAIARAYDATGIHLSDVSEMAARALEAQQQRHQYDHDPETAANGDLRCSLDVTKIRASARLGKLDVASEQLDELRRSVQAERDRPGKERTGLLRILEGHLLLGEAEYSYASGRREEAARSIAMAIKLYPQYRWTNLPYPPHERLAQVRAEVGGTSQALDELMERPPSPQPGQQKGAP